ncbi:hypothetical protein GUITHDRAFT_137364 [Guillardia theta CCMP2712]|uniref:AAA+ ATPase domain-containing protein n=1 Tax=Guillardia theta (strain CCMP2712) TaxID=905079 RepID=L1JGD9_GUITC|nr:hypothetical protein GUITHDRAFT_137364 [Guillardia theta CCMP2712]EKX47588.1 hypothetical protein GUITHDRAFT_137364 [Guillardia theta CCMP2712]|eukprot:XP_005834568.1 hypothetical protein GUITHDRAFT_137364 [Guillardia theta CCMP2712]
MLQDTNVQQFAPSRSSDAHHGNDLSDRDSKRREYDRFHAEVLTQLMSNLSKHQSDNKVQSARGSGLKSAPTRFKTHEEYVETFRPLVMEEIGSEIEQSLKEKLYDSHPAELSSDNNEEDRNRRDGPGTYMFENHDFALIEVCKMVWIKGLASSPKKSAMKDPSGKSPVKKESGKWVKSGEPRKFYAIVAGNFHAHYSQKFLCSVRVKTLKSVDLEFATNISKSKVAADDACDVFSLTCRQSEIRYQWSIQRLRNMGASIREWRAVHEIKNSPLLHEILNPNKFTSLPNDDEVAKIMGHLNPVVQTHIASRSNKSQLVAIAAACDPAHRTGVTLLQGPPGTGKTTVILSILNFLHLTQYQQYYESVLKVVRSKLSVQAGTAAKTPEPVNIDSGKYHSGALESILHDIQKTPSDHTPKVLPKPRILICAPSNAAVDHIVERVLSERLRDGNGLYTPDMIRIGSPNACHHKIRVVTLDHQVQEIMSRGGELEDCKHRYRSLLTRRSYLEAECKGVGATNSLEVEMLKVRTQLEEVERDIKRLEVVKKIKSSKEEDTDQLRTMLLDDAQVILTTLSSAGLDCFSRLQNKIDTVIIDEACQSVEAGTLIPLLLGARRCILVGDPRQLPATVISQSSSAAIYQRSLFERLMSCNHPVALLNVQYRMHPEITRFPSEYFYEGRLVDAENLGRRKEGERYQADPWFGPFHFFDLIDSKEQRSDGSSLRNVAEAKFVALLVKELISRYSQRGELKGKIAILTPYRQQRNEITSSLKRLVGPHAVSESVENRSPEVVTELARGYSIDVMTVDSCQGQERDIVIFSCVRANTRGVGFLEDVRRMNVALTRARHSLLVIGNSNSLKASEPWKAFLANAKKRERVTVIESKKMPPDFTAGPPEPGSKYLNDHDDEDIVPCETEECGRSEEADREKDQAMNEQRNALKLAEEEQRRKRKAESDTQGSKRRHVEKKLDDDVIIIDACCQLLRIVQCPISQAAQSSSSSQPGRGLPAKAVQEIVKRSGGVLSCDQLLKCETCKENFLFTVSDHQRLIDRGISSIPSRCKSCRLSSSSVRVQGGQEERKKAQVEEAIKQKYLEGSKSAADKIKAMTAREISTSSLWKERAKALDKGKSGSQSSGIKGFNTRI